MGAKSLKLREFLCVGAIALAQVLCLGAACAAGSPAPTAAGTTPSAVAPTPAAAAGQPVSGDYLIGPGDQLHIFVFQNEELSVTVPVRPDGKISTPLVEDMVAVGKTPSQLARDIEKSLAEYVKSPKVNVVVMGAMSVFSQVKVIGQVVKPQALAYRDGMTVLDAILAVGGLSQFAAGNRAHVVRTEKGKQVEIKVKLDSLVNSGDMKQNVPLRPGDVLVVPESRF
ncbi:MAG TPA: XrtA/PEP-CTERM system exopolysaccharide export protein [Steroidobacteraceae bacterium]|jgi:polysaccharide export outer membrane protein|nr:XrtA/PEP-CTERM system exopolysaccharide export protein [Steroidobacteraceae bacterium]